VEALFLPQMQTVGVGDKLVTTLMIDAKTYLLTGADLRVKYDQDKLNLDSVNVLTKENANGSTVWLQSPNEVVMSSFDSSAGTFNLVGTNTEKDVTNLPTGVVSMVKLNFTAKASGVATVSLDSGYGNIITGYNSAGSDQELGIDKVTGASYTITAATSPTAVPTTAGTGTVDCRWCGTNCIDYGKRQNMGVCAEIYVEGKACVNENGTCMVISKLVISSGPTRPTPTSFKAGGKLVAPGNVVY
jgi:hypothetical protein